MPDSDVRPLRFILPTRVRRSLPPSRIVDQLVSVLDGIAKLRRIPRLKNPTLFNDHLLQIKANGSLYDPLRQFVTDKEYVKKYVAATVGNEYVIPTFAVFRAVDDLQQLDSAQPPYVVKPTHMSGPITICLDKDSPVDPSVIKSWLAQDYYRMSREGNYRYLQPKVIVEDYFSPDGTLPPDDYKIFCFHGIPKLIEVDSGRFQCHTRNFYDTSWRRLPFTVKYPPRSESDPKPHCLDDLLGLASELSRPFTSIRVDLYAHSGRIKVGELTNCHGGGTEFVNPPEAEEWLGALFDPRQVTGSSMRLRPN